MSSIVGSDLIDRSHLSSILRASTMTSANDDDVDDNDVDEAVLPTEGR
jgi:hypothetical protein